MNPGHEPIYVSSGSESESDGGVEFVKRRVLDVEETARMPPAQRRRRETSSGPEIAGGGEAPPSGAGAAATETTLAEDKAKLREEGYVVIDVLKPVQILYFRNELDKSLRNEWTKREYTPTAFDSIADELHPATNPRLRPHTGTKGPKWYKFVGGGFAALGNPSSFHDLIVRELRREVYKAVVEKNIFDDTKNISEVIDRLLIRTPDQKVTEEKWHRDVAVHTLPGDEVYGGWLNLDAPSPLTPPQKFSCIPRTHRGVIEDGKGGFVTQLSSMDKQTIATHEQKGKKGGIIEIKPGQLLVFNERLIHEVVGAATETPMLRLFTGWYVTKQTEPHDSRPDDILGVVGNNEARLRARLAAQAVMPIKSGQLPAMIPKIYWTNHPDKISPAVADIRNAGTDLRPRKPELKVMGGQNIRSPWNPTVLATSDEYWRTLPSLAFMRTCDDAIELWPKYDERDVQILLPKSRADALALAKRL